MKKKTSTKHAVNALGMATMTIPAGMTWVQT
jgi:hypothetical protein